MNLNWRSSRFPSGPRTDWQRLNPSTGQPPSRWLATSIRYFSCASLPPWKTERIVGCCELLARDQVVKARSNRGGADVPVLRKQTIAARSETRQALVPANESGSCSPQEAYLCPGYRWLCRRDFTFGESLH